MTENTRIYNVVIIKNKNMELEKLLNNKEIMGYINPQEYEYTIESNRRH